MIRRPPRSTLFPSRRSSDLGAAGDRLATTPVSEEPLQPPTMQWRLSNLDRKSTRLNSSHGYISYAVFCLKKKKNLSQLSMLLHLGLQSSLLNCLRRYVLDVY